MAWSRRQENISTSRFPLSPSTRPTPSAPSTRIGSDLARRKLIIRAAKFAGDGNLAVLDHMVAIILRKALEHCLDIVARARAFRAQRIGTEYPHPRLVKKAVNQLLAGNRWVNQLKILDSR